MTCAAHALLAGAVGAFARTRGRAFFAGVATHLLADLVPHRDFDVPREALMVLAALAGVGAVAGFDSRAFAGAVGGVVPDIENGLAAGEPAARLCFPSHRGVHGRRADRLSHQVLLALACAGVILWQARCRARPHGRS